MTGTSIAASQPTMRKYEARFHPHRGEEDAYVIVGYVVWDANRSDQRARVEPPSTFLGAMSPHVMFTTLCHLVRVAGARAHERLKSLPSKHWSFVDVTTLPIGQAI
jgi:hypothetical protein